MGMALVTGMLMMMVLVMREFVGAIKQDDWTDRFFLPLVPRTLWQSVEINVRILPDACTWHNYL